MNIRRLVFYTNEILKDEKILVISDLHLTGTQGFEHFNQIRESNLLEEEKINTILLPGDIVNDVEELADRKFRKRVQEALIENTEGRQTIVSKGNHDQMTKKGKDWIYGGEEHIFERTLEEIENVTYLDNVKTITLPNNIKVGAFSPFFTYYEGFGESKKEFERQFEEEYNSKKFSPDTFNLFLVHEPQSIIYLSEEAGSCIQPNTDIVISGHMHDGLTPKMLEPIMKNKGLVSPQMKLFPKYAQGIVDAADTTFVINGPMNARVEWPKINEHYEPRATIIELKKDGYQKIKK